ncbi:AAA family ATPase [Pseudomonas glycinis]|jgi:ABC-type cobalamin/Fe3+-siderophores transport system ATPase subunit
MLRISRLKVQGFQHPERSVDVSFSNNPVSIIYGDNGCGKTTFLKLLFAALNQQTSALLEESVQELTIEYTDENETKKITIALISTEVESESPASERYDWSQLQNSPLGKSRSLSIGVERGLATQPIRIDPQIIHRFLMRQREYVRESRYYPDNKEFAYDLAQHLNRAQQIKSRNRNQELDVNEQHLFVKSIEIGNIESLLLEQYRLAKSVATEKIQNALFDTLASVIDGQLGPVLPTDTSVREISGALVKSRDRIIEALAAGPENTFKSQVIQTLKQIEREDDVAPLLKNEIFAKLIINMVGELQVEKQLLSSINHLIDTFNDFLIGGKKLEIIDNQLKVLVGRSEHSVNYLSSGERHILTFLALVVTVGRSRQFLIIDEPEISLNIKWQRILMNVIIELVPNTQIIVATHSPIISSDTLDSLVKLVPQESSL